MILANLSFFGFFGRQVSQTCLQHPLATAVFHCFQFYLNRLLFLLIVPHSSKFYFQLTPTLSRLEVYTGIPVFFIPFLHPATHRPRMRRCSSWREDYNPSIVYIRRWNLRTTCPSYTERRERNRVIGSSSFHSTRAPNTVAQKHRPASVIVTALFS